MIEMRSLTALILALTISGSAHGEAITFGPDLAASGWSVVTFPGVSPVSFKAVSYTHLTLPTTPYV